MNSQENRSTDSPGDAEIGQSPSRLHHHWLRHRSKLFVFWIIADLIWVGARIAIVAVTLQKYGVSVWGFAIVDILASLPWTIGSAKVADKIILRDYAHVWKWLAIALFGFLAPDVYLLVHSGKFPTSVLLAVIGTISLLSIISLSTLARKIRRGRQEQSQASEKSGT